MAPKKSAGTRDVPNATTKTNTPREVDTEKLEATELPEDVLTGFKSEIERLPYSHNEQRRFAHVVIPILIDEVKALREELTALSADFAAQK